MSRTRAETITRGRIPGASDTHRKLAAALGVTVEELRGDVPPKTGRPRDKAVQAARLVGLPETAITRALALPDDSRSELAWFRQIEAFADT